MSHFPIPPETSLEDVLQDTLTPLDSLADLLRAGGYHDVEIVASSLVRDSRARLQAVTSNLERGYGHKIMLRDFGGALALEDVGETR